MEEIEYKKRKTKREKNIIWKRERERARNKENGSKRKYKVEILPKFWKWNCR